MSHRQKNKNKSRHRIHADKSTGAAQLPKSALLKPVVTTMPETAPQVVATPQTPVAKPVAA